MQLALLGPTHPYRGGISHHTTLLYSHLLGDHTVTFFSFIRQYPSFLFPGKDDRDPSEQILSASCRYTLDPLNPFTWLLTAYRIQQTGARWLIMPWWVPFWSIPFFTIARLVRSTGMRVLYLCHNVVPHEANFADRSLTRIALSQGDVFVVQSQRDEGLLREYFPPRPIYRTGHPVYDMFATQSLTKDVACQHLGLDSTKPMILFFGFVRPYKGLHYLLEALAQMRHELDVHLLLVGEFWRDKEAYLEQIHTLGLDAAVTIVDQYVPNEKVPLYFSAADVVVLPYLETSQSGVMQLAYGFNKPVITTQAVALSSCAVSVNQNLVVPPGDTDALATAVLTFFADPSAYAINSASLGEQASWGTLVKTIEMGIEMYDRSHG
jgi:glycosyltransferase involved in cell wall biosynthesis